MVIVSGERRAIHYYLEWAWMQGRESWYAMNHCQGRRRVFFVGAMVVIVRTVTAMMDEERSGRD